ncbi:VWA domain-containing protein [Polaribacter vadi]|uniref:vWA domain-containing protein n=1 Tax=Polaribacter TaxID=52959 RepID=UPI001C0A0428|nr:MULTISPECIES: vWA domain-containing protein [Polaribacter]MBU3010427.1 VWA domain-containing protein [Polaribacter vadi]MDO6740235.1 VWA domain-containing protein [Polaribacter sp. 1_MG-2023]
MKSLVLKVTSILFVLASTFSFANHQTDKETVKNQTIKVALLLDTSNSMDGLINQAKAQLWEIVNELSYAKYGMQKPDLEIALYEYGNSNLPSREGFIRQVLQFSNDLDEISEKLFSLTTNGGNEFCGQVISTSLKELSWGKNKNDLKLLFIAGNEPFTQGKINYKDAITDAKEKDVVINTIFCGNYSNGISGMWKNGADLGGGDYMTINQDKKVVHIITPYDDDIIILNKKLNATYIYYGNAGYSKFSNQKTQDENALEMNEAVVVKRAVSKSSRLYENSNWDLVDADKKEKVDYKSIEKKKLPKILQNKSATEIKNYVKQKANERAEIQKKIKELDIKRRSFIAKKQKEGTQKDVLNNVMIKAIKRQAELKNYTW